MRTITYLKITLMALFLAFQSNTFAQTYDVYLCDNTVTLVPNLTAPATIAATDEVLWTNVATGVVTTKAGTDPNFTTPSLAVGAHSYTVTIKSAANCTGDPSTPITIYKLPAITAVTLGTPSVSTYCTNATTPQSTITATATIAGGASLPSGVTLNYAWTASKNSAAYTNAESGIGSDNGGTGTTNIFTMVTTDVGVYELRATVNYQVASGALRAANGCPVVSDTKTVTVAPKPEKPTITVL